MAKRGMVFEEKADSPIRLTPSIKARLKAYKDKHGLQTLNEAVSIALDVAEAAEKILGNDIMIKAKPSVTVKGS